MATQTFYKEYIPIDEFDINNVEFGPLILKTLDKEQIKYYEASISYKVGENKYMKLRLELPRTNSKYGISDDSKFAKNQLGMTISEQKVIDIFDQIHKAAVKFYISTQVFIKDKRNKPRIVDKNGKIPEHPDLDVNLFMDAVGDILFYRRYNKDNAPSSDQEGEVIPGLDPILYTKVRNANVPFRVPNLTPNKSKRMTIPHDQLKKRSIDMIPVIEFPHVRRTQTGSACSVRPLLVSAAVINISDSGIEVFQNETLDKLEKDDSISHEAIADIHNRISDIAQTISKQTDVTSNVEDVNDEEEDVHQKLVSSLK